MLTTNIITFPGEHALFLDGHQGPLEAFLSVPDAMDKRYIALLGHPHSLQGGTMNNKVVTTMARACRDLHIASLRFNFRGVGQSAGVYDAGVGESEDMVLIARECLKVLPDARFIFAGFSFGSYVAFRAAQVLDPALLITVAPPVHHFDYDMKTTVPSPWIVVQGDEDEVVPLQDVLQFVSNIEPPISLLRFDDTGHFFHGRLMEFKTRLMDAIRAQVDVA